MVYNVEELALEAIDSQGAWRQVPAQFEILERWWAQDLSLRHVVVHFLGSVGAIGSGRDIQEFRVVSAGETDPPQPTNPATLVETDERFILSNGLVWVEVDKKTLSIRTSSGELTAALVDKGGSAQQSFNRSDAALVSVVREESGPLRAVLRVSAPTRYRTADPSTKVCRRAPRGIQHEHGWAMRLYVYANVRLIRVDFQLQNSTKDAQWAAPLYFRSFELRIAPQQASKDRSRKLVTPRGAKRSATSARVISTDSDLGCLSAGNVAIAARRFKELGPTGLRADPDGSLVFEMFPDATASPGLGLGGKDYYWLDDMRHTLKEFLLWDHQGSAGDADVTAFAKTFDHQPTATVPTEWFKMTRVTLDLSGLVPTGVPRSRSGGVATDERKNNRARANETWTNGWDDFGLSPKEPSRKGGGANQGGGYPQSGAYAVITEAPGDMFDAEDRALAEINIRSFSMEGYAHQRDFKCLRLSSRVYADVSSPGYNWRFAGAATEYRDAEVGISGSFSRFWDRRWVAGTKMRGFAMHDSHAWLYHVAEAYLLTGNLWLRDWFRFVAQFRSVALLRKDKFPDPSSRAVAHMLASAVYAYRFTGDLRMQKQFRRYISGYLLRTQDPVTGFRDSTSSPPAGEGSFQAGYLARALISVYVEAGTTKLQDLARDSLERVMRFQFDLGRFRWYVRKDGTSRLPEHGLATAGDSFPMVDPQYWFAAELRATERGAAGSQAWYGKSPRPFTAAELKAQVDEYMSTQPVYSPNFTIASGPFAPPAGPTLAFWSGDFGGRLSEMFRAERDLDAYDPVPRLSSASERRRAGGSLTGDVHVMVSTKGLIKVERVEGKRAKTVTIEFGGDVRCLREVMKRGGKLQSVPRGVDVLVAHAPDIDVRVRIRRRRLKPKAVRLVVGPKVRVDE